MAGENRVYIIADTHFGHEMLVTNGYRPKGYGWKILKNIAALQLQLGDVLYHLGDVVLSKQEAEHHANLIQSAWLGNVVLIRGNHDKRSNSAYLKLGYDAVTDGVLLNLYGRRILLSHAPVDPVGDWFDFNVHGHLHDNQHRTEEFPFLGSKHVLYSCEQYHYQPVQLKSLLKERL